LKKILFLIILATSILMNSCSSDGGSPSGSTTNPAEDSDSGAEDSDSGSSLVDAYFGQTNFDTSKFQD
jgi:hypothetical protein